MNNKNEIKKVSESIKDAHEECDRLQRMYQNLFEQLYETNKPEIKRSIREKMAVCRVNLTVQIDYIHSLKKERSNLLIKRQLTAF